MHGRYFDTVFFFKDCFQLLDDMISTLTTECFQELEEEGFNRYAHPDKHLRLQASCTYLLTYACVPAGSTGHRPRNTTVFCWCPSFSRCISSPLFLLLCFLARFRGLPLRLFRGGFHVIGCRVVVSEGVSYPPPFCLLYLSHVDLVYSYVYTYILQYGKSE